MKTQLTTTLIAFLFIGSAFAAEDILIASFENDTYAPWTVTGEAFGTALAKGTLRDRCRWMAAVAWHEYKPQNLNVSLFSKGGDLVVTRVTAWKMKSIYEITKAQ